MVPLGEFDNTNQDGGMVRSRVVEIMIERVDQERQRLGHKKKAQKKIWNLWRESNGRGVALGEYPFARK